MPQRAGQPKPKKPRECLNNIHAVVIMGLPNGKVKTTMSEGMAAHPVCLRQVENLEAAMHCIMLEDRIKVNTHARAAARLEQMGGSGAERETIGIAASKVALRESRAAFTEHIRPMMHELDLELCSDVPGSMWQSCVMEAGADACAAGGPCKHAREVLDWPEDLACVDPNRVGPGMPWARRFFQWLIEMGKVEVMPASLRGKQRWGMCMRASVIRHCSSSPILLQMVTLCFSHAASRSRRLGSKCVAALLPLRLGGRCSRSLRRCSTWSWRGLLQACPSTCTV